MKTFADLDTYTKCSPSMKSTPQRKRKHMNDKLAEYRSRLVDSRKIALVDACIAADANNEPWPAEWPGLRPELYSDVLTKLRRYGLGKAPSPVSQVVKSWNAAGEQRATYQPPKATKERAAKAETPVTCEACVEEQERLGHGALCPRCYDRRAYAPKRPKAAREAAKTMVTLKCADCDATNETPAGSGWRHVNEWRCGACYGVWEKTERNAREELAALRAAERKASMIQGTYSHSHRAAGGVHFGTYNLYPAHTKLADEVQKACFSKMPDPRSYLRGKAYIGQRAVPVFNGALFTETMGGEPWGVALGRMMAIANAIGWGTKDGMKPGDLIPRTIAEATPAASHAA